ncbi:MFS transporter [Thalassospira sp. A40-3]|uniref:MFS transporter n=1 Tax=Thalassospira sp. A40-3 TaxID=2785908 RepID=UPI0018CDEF31|nr:MFS transporter [Thalassospira sp. A40-3]QPO13286.1 MFS transporter [Thalassospira sp. A40-3]
MPIPHIPRLKISPEVHPDGLPGPRRIYAALALLITIMMAVLDGTIMNVALPAIAHDQGATPAHAIWVITAYQLAIVVALLPFSALGEAIGFRKVYLSGVALFGVASALCAMAPTIELLTAARVLQGLGAAAIMSINAAIMRHVFPHAKLGQAIGWIAMTVSVSAAAGPSIASAIMAVASWHWLFLINLPLSVLAVVIGYFSLPFNTPSRARFDFISAFLNVLTFGGLVAALGNMGIESNPILIGAQFAVSLVAGVFLVHRQLSRTRPMLPLDLLKIPVFACSIGSSITGFCAQMIAFVTLPFYFHDVLGQSATMTGLLMTPWPVATAIIAPIAGRLADRFSPIRLTGIGMAVFAIGLYGTTLAADAGGLVPIIAALALCGAGFGLFQAPNNRLMLTSAPRERSGGASGLLSTARLTGQSVGAALAAILIGTGGGFDLATIMLVASGSAIISAIICEGRRHALRSGLIASPAGL